jgi:hypothetical protein
MEKSPKAIYLGIKAESVKSRKIISVALVMPTGRWFYAEVTDFQKADCAKDVLAQVVPRLTKVPGTVFVKREDLGKAILEWLSATAEGGAAKGGPLPRFMFRGQRRMDWVSLCDILKRAEGAPGRFSLRKPNPQTLNVFTAHCGGVAKAGHHALMDAIGLAVCDEQRTEPLDFEKISHLELLLGTKGAMTYRAWVRRHEASRGRPAAQVTSVDESIGSQRGSFPEVAPVAGAAA